MNTIKATFDLFLSSERQDFKNSTISFEETCNYNATATRPTHFSTE